MIKSDFTAIYAGDCYIKSYLRLYDKGVLLKDIKDAKGNLIFKEIKTNRVRAFVDCNNLKPGDEISFKAKLTDERRLLYISDIKVSDEA